MKRPQIKSKYVYNGTTMPVVKIQVEFVIPGDLIAFVMEHKSMTQRAAVAEIYNQYAGMADCQSCEMGVGIDDQGDLVWTSRTPTANEFVPSLLERETTTQFRRDGQAVDLGQDPKTPGFIYRGQ